MPMPAKDLWNKIQKEMRGQSDRAQLDILRRHLEGWHDSWKGPYADLKKKLLKLAAKLETVESVRKSHAPGTSLHVRRQGLGQVAVIGLPNSGKSALVSALTDAPTQIADYPFATQDLVPAMLACDGGAIQLVDTPPIVERLSEGEGAGRTLLAMLANADALVLTLDLSGDPAEQLRVIRQELAEGHLDCTPGPIETEVHPKGHGGLRFSGQAIPRTDQDEAVRILTEAGVQHAEVTVRGSLDREDLRAATARRKRLPTLIAAHKRDVEGAADAIAGVRQTNPEYRVVPTDFFTDMQGPRISEALARLLGYIRIRIVDRAAEDAGGRLVQVLRASTVREVAAEALGQDADDIRSARIAGPSASQPWQTVGLQHLVADGDAICLRGQ